MKIETCPVCGGKLHVFLKDDIIVCVQCDFSGNLKLWEALRNQIIKDQWIS